MTMGEFLNGLRATDRFVRGDLIVKGKSDPFLPLKRTKNATVEYGTRGPAMTF
jgi:hypothetical protein